LGGKFLKQAFDPHVAPKNFDESSAGIPSREDRTMHINEVGLSAKGLDPRPEVQSASAQASAGTNAAGAANTPAAAQVTAFVLSPEIRRWLNALRDQPEVRADAIKKAAEKLAKGLYNRPEVASELADAMLKAID
jgi:hypothetical protein